jgi:hypothetical protein
MQTVIAGLDPAIQLSSKDFPVKMDARVVRREDGASHLSPGHDE